MVIVKCLYNEDEERGQSGYRSAVQDALFVCGGIGVG